MPSINKLASSKASYRHLVNNWPRGIIAALRPSINWIRSSGYLVRITLLKWELRGGAQDWKVRLSSRPTISEFPSQEPRHRIICRRRRSINFKHRRVINTNYRRASMRSKMPQDRRKEFYLAIRSRLFRNMEPA